MGKFLDMKQLTFKYNSATFKHNNWTLAHKGHCLEFVMCVNNDISQFLLILISLLCQYWNFKTLSLLKLQNYWLKIKINSCQNQAWTRNWTFSNPNSNVFIIVVKMYYLVLQIQDTLLQWFFLDEIHEKQTLVLQKTSLGPIWLQV